MSGASPRRDRVKEDASAISEAAACWLALRDGPEGLTADQQRAFADWLRADPRHAEEFEKHASCWAQLDALQAFRPDGIGQPIPDLPLRPRPARWRLVSRRIAPLAAAAAVVLAASAFWWRAAPAPAAFSQLAETTVGSVKKIALPDGSTVDLNTDSAVQVDLNARERSVILVRGEAYFTVARDAARPFVVGAGDVRVRAVGTAFSVRRHDALVEILVTHGRVGVDDAHANTSLLPAETSTTSAPTLAAGQRALVRPAQRNAIEALSTVEITRRLAWQERRLEFGPTPLREIVAEFNRYSTRPLVLGDPAVAELSVGGSFRIGDEETLVRFLQASFPIEVERGERATTLRSKP